jgi:predicted DCC family thiol-disulfide oxidoreductase YuxK
VTPQIVVFDAHCLLCSGVVRFLLARDSDARLRFASTQSPTGAQLMREAGLDPTDPTTLLLVSGARAYRETAAVLRILHALGWPWRAAWIAWAIPAPIRDAAYRWVARRRYRLFGRSAACFLPRADQRARFIDLDGASAIDAAAGDRHEQ